MGVVITSVTNGIRVSVETFYEGRFRAKNGPYYFFSYHIVVENMSPETVQLLGRHWFIYDTGEGPSEVEGDGVVGIQPVIPPGAKHSYRSGCQLRAGIGTMVGTFRMARTMDDQSFIVSIPRMDFFATPRLN